MSTRYKKGQLVRVSAGQTVGTGRASRGHNANALDHKPLGGEEGALTGFVYALTDPALYGPEGAAKDKAQEHVRYARKKLRASVESEDDARELFELALVQVGELRTLRNAHPTARSHLVEQRVAAVMTMRELRVTTRTARTSVAVASRLQALGLALLDEGAKTLDLTQLSKGKDFLSTSGLMLDRALDLDRRAKASVTPQWPWTTTPNNSDRASALSQVSGARSETDDYVDDDETDDDESDDSDAVDVDVSDLASPQTDPDGARGPDRHASHHSGLSLDSEIAPSRHGMDPPTHPRASMDIRPPPPDPSARPATNGEALVKRLSAFDESTIASGPASYVRPPLPPHLAELNAGNPFFVAQQAEQDRLNAIRAAQRRAEIEATQELPPLPPRPPRGPVRNAFKKKDRNR